MTQVGDRTVDGVEVVEATGRLDATSAPEFEDRLLGAVEQGRRRIVVDCTRLEYVSSAGLRVLLIAAKRLATAGGAIAIVAPAGPVRDILAIVGFDSVFPVVPVVSDAVAAVRSGASAG